MVDQSELKSPGAIARAPTRCSWARSPRFFVAKMRPTPVLQRQPGTDRAQVTHDEVVEDRDQCGALLVQDLRRPSQGPRPGCLPRRRTAARTPARAPLPPARRGLPILPPASGLRRPRGAGYARQPTHGAYPGDHPVGHVQVSLAKVPRASHDGVIAPVRAVVFDEVDRHIRQARDDNAVARAAALGTWRPRPHPTWQVAQLRRRALVFTPTRRLGRPGVAARPGGRHGCSADLRAISDLGQVGGTWAHQTPAGPAATFGWGDSVPGLRNAARPRTGLPCYDRCGAKRTRRTG